MKQFWVEGLYLPAATGKKARTSKPAEPQPFYHSFWAETAQDALRQAAEEIHGGTWLEGPKILKTSEEQRMRSIGAPELPLFEKKRKK